MRGITIKIDRLTRSIEDAQTGERYETVMIRALPEQVNELKKPHWLFDWKAELGMPGREVYKLIKVIEPKVIHGLVCLEDMYNPIHVHLVESAKFNRGQKKHNYGVAGNLFAFACKLSLEKGYEGFVTFESKTKLIDHYLGSLGAKILWGNRMVLENDVAKNLIIQYFS
jgi:hypothetical protein